jgi:broad specificity phosphatase PhoE
VAAIYLARHGSHALVDQVLLGRSDPIGLSEKGRGEAWAAAAILKDADIGWVQSSPRRRCRETAMLIATELGVPLSIETALDELDYGRWTGERFETLEQDEHWNRWNQSRGSVRPPAGESAVQAQSRILDHVAKQARSTLPAILMVTHAELIRCLLLAQRGLGLDDWHRIAVPPGSVVRAEPRETADENNMKEVMDDGLFA